MQYFVFKKAACIGIHKHALTRYFYFDLNLCTDHWLTFFEREKITRKNPFNYNISTIVNQLIELKMMYVKNYITFWENIFYQ